MMRTAEKSGSLGFVHDSAMSLSPGLPVKLLGFPGGVVSGGGGGVNVEKFPACGVAKLFNVSCAVIRK